MIWQFAEHLKTRASSLSTRTAEAPVFGCESAHKESDHAAKTQEIM
jgi:hypothetical protein